ncbi:hypothetical protein LTR10_021784 [Elasticomyces elasticus]|uniref:Uncharacterized protein n=1 Tax=Exophiala sideris TaxID=1016849 RepID=A0ABR0J5Z5_9EURO|nr:hypothetical protein LTR10_021784 [Elasticomyces elasticus]KAK5028722.1 hypothetical protein LTS07_006101 [Exophiala sideris]KAK5035590.1 hypothetical protein LTR13_005719 [Exophiala sideris]KAK5057226.1 hypothetical protein LTR69_007265 [Exophiala sideris]KAK5181801.1 hypothetical protein LTR44_006001 [Eurotiomycetes sp. CCFEE 6388]
MHRPVHRDDYLLARGANPRTGVITPGTHSASSSIDYYEDAPARGSGPQGRWRQKGEQWVSSDLGRVTPPKQRHQGPYPYTLRTPRRLASGDMNSSMGDSVHVLRPPGPQQAAPRELPPDTSATFRLLKHSEGIDIYPEISFSDINKPLPLEEPNEDSALRRKAVGSPPNKMSMDHGSEVQGRRNDSEETVLRTPRFQLDLRTSSAPVPARVRNITPLDKDKDLPTLPRDSDASLIKEYQTIATQNPFLDPPKMNPTTDGPASRTSNTSGRPPVEKDLPCLPMNSGPFQWNQAATPNRQTPLEEKRISPKTLPTSDMETPKGPRGGDPAYPFVRTARQTHPAPHTKVRNDSLGGKAMPIPTYDNPPKHQSPPLVRTSLTRAEGPRSMPAPTTRPPDRPPRGPEPSPLSTTTTSIDITMGNPAIPRQLQGGPRPSMAEPRTMNPGRPSMPRRPPPPAVSSIFMNTGMNMSMDSMMPVPLPRTRPRQNNHQPVQMRAEGMYAFPRQGPRLSGSYTSDTMFQQRRPVDLGSITIPSPVERQSELMPPPLKPRLPSNQSRQTIPDMSTDRSEEVMSGLGLTRKCSRCHNGFVDVKQRNIDGAIRTSVHQKAGDEANEGSKKSHPVGSPLPEVPEEIDPSAHEATSNEVIEAHQNQNVDIPEDDHDICCPDCCKEDCHESCLGHPSPSTMSSPTKSIWSDIQSPSSASEFEDWEDNGAFKTPKKPGKAVQDLSVTTKLSPKHVNFKDDKKARPKLADIGSATSSPVELSAQPRTPSSPCKDRPVEYAGLALAAAISATRPSNPFEDPKDALAAALSATGSSNPKIYGPGLHKRQRSLSSPAIAPVTSSQKSSETPVKRTASISRLRVPTPVGLSISCSGSPKSRSTSARSVATLELQVPSLESFGGGAVGEMVLGSFEATKIWIADHPQLMKVGWEALERGWQMAQITMVTGSRLWAVVFVYSRTGKLKLNVAKGETAGGFMFDCARSLVYLLLFAAVAAFFIRTLRIVLGVVGIVGWLFQAVFWVLKQVVGLGAAR